MGKNGAVACCYFYIVTQEEQSPAAILGPVLKQIVGGLSQELKKSLAEEKAQVRTLVDKNQKLRSKNSELQNQEKVSREEMKEISTMVNELSKKLEPAMKGMLVPIVAAVVLKAVYKRAVGASPSSFGNPVDRAAKIRSRKDEYATFGCKNQAQVEELADVWSGMIDARNTAAHVVTGDDVVEILPHCGDQLRHVLERASGHSGGYPPVTGVTAKQL
ncbi:hypothetical protein HOY82DRAFT_595218 [Tuber indicum]|nr:hypothetical protein HOY82DRAFT_595218 [Tuber indicum]